MPDEFPRKRSLDQSDIDSLRQHMHAIERLHAEADFIRLKLAEYRQSDYASTAIHNGVASLQDTAEFIREVIQELTERERPTT
ncbi:hypothetical protein [Aporhodopirellula aestuarii]|uniref:Uncharacterized protein n=1 Tax=Aporhodopirellula aestuarii TaxID=2950107 RepID=A0ABT0UD54_9BACT|nr:hypothetical protein [Aporhodopirellula aestuarii]MCM2374690.1 hypothetical protein [Aporhodopirellula aestuarii]